MTVYSIDIHATKTQIVGKLNIRAIKNLVGIDFPSGKVYMYPGAIKHVRKRHPGILERYGHWIPKMIANPDYIGQHPSISNSLEIIKVAPDQLLLSIQLDPAGYLYVSSFFQLNNGQKKYKIVWQAVESYHIRYKTRPFQIQCVDWR